MAQVRIDQPCGIAERGGVGCAGDSGPSLLKTTAILQFSRLADHGALCARDLASSAEVRRRRRESNRANDL
jgi:hypothetical protein